MNEKYNDSFIKHVNKNIYSSYEKSVTPIIEKSICEEKSNDEYDYSIKIKHKIIDDYSVFFRLENIKEEANYLVGGKRCIGKDNDFTIIDDHIYQFEIKRAKRMGGHLVQKQFDGGIKWLNHLLYLLSSNDKQENENRKQINCVYNIYIFLKSPQRGMSRGRNEINEAKDHCQISKNKKYIIYETNYVKNKIINLDNLIRKSKGFGISEKLYIESIN